MQPAASLRWTAEDSALPAGYVREGHKAGDCWRHAALGYEAGTKAEWSWLTTGRVTVLLCGPCRDEWQGEADADPALKPVSVVPIGNGADDG
jgi:hypothetical protein